MAGEGTKDFTELDWITLKNDLGTAELKAVETSGDKFMRKFKENPFVPIAGGDYLSEESVLRPYPLLGGKRRHCCPVNGDGFTVITACFTVFTAALTVALIIQINYGSPQVDPLGAVATDYGDCSSIGVEVMKAGGSGVDAAIAATFCMTVVHPHAIGPGGSGVMLVHEHKTNSTVVIDFMTAVPNIHKFTPNSPSPPLTGGASIGVPGLIKGLEHAHHKYGKLSWSRLVQPSINIAKNGFKVSNQLIEAIKTSNLTSDDGVSEFDKTFFPKGIMLEQGSFMKRQKYAILLEKVAKHGAESIYLLDFGAEEMSTLRAVDAELRVTDFENYKLHEHECIHIAIKNMSVFTAPAPFGGPQLLTALQLLYNSKITQSTSASFLYHSFIEALRRSYADYIKLGYAEESSLRNLTEMLLLSTVDEVIDSTVTQANPQIPRLPHQAASPISVIDTFDQYVTIVAGLGSHFGSRVMTEHGILFNNHLANLLPSTSTPPPRVYHPFTSYTPVVITDANNVCGARTVLSSSTVSDMVQVVTQLLLRHRSLMDAIEQPRITIKPGVDSVFVEDLRKGARLPGSVRNDLIEMSHVLQMLQAPYISVTGVTKTKDSLMSWSDSRGGGLAHRLQPTLLPHNASMHSL